MEIILASASPRRRELLKYISGEFPAASADCDKTLPDGTTDKNYYVPESVGIATGLLINALRNAGLSSLTYTPAPMTFLCDMFHRPQGERCEMVLVCGKPDPTWEKPVLTKKTYEEISEEY